MMMAEGVARQLNPKADMWQLAKPLAEDWMAQEASLPKRRTSGQSGFRADNTPAHSLTRLNARSQNPAITLAITFGSWRDWTCYSQLFHAFSLICIFV